MARFTFPSERLVYLSGKYKGPLRSAAGVLYEVFTDAGANTLADIVDMDDVPIENSVIKVNTNSLLPEFQGPDNVSQLWILPVGANPDDEPMSIKSQTLVLSGNDAYYRHVQSVPNDTWVIPHNLGKRPSVLAVDSSGQIIIGRPTYDSDMQVTIVHTAAVAGEAYLN